MRIEQHCDAIYEGLGEHQASITRDIVKNILEQITKRHPDLNDEVITGIRSAIQEAIIQNIRFADKDAFYLMVVADLEEKEVLHKEVIPDEIDIDPAVLGRLEEIWPFIEDERQKKINAYIILNSSTRNEVDRKCGAAKYGADATQLLVPLLHKLCEKNEGAKDRIRCKLSKLRIFEILDDVPNLLDWYCFEPGNTQPYYLLTLQYGDQLNDSDAQKELHEAFVEIMLVVLKEYLMG